MDKIDKATRSLIMSKVHSKNTKLELHVRSVSHKLGYRFRLQRKDLPGKPDLVFPRLRIALFVHGCFWHGHNCPHGRREPVTNVDYWKEKIKRNMERDIEAQNELIKLGWMPIVVWECQVYKEDFPQRINRLLVTNG